MKVLNTEDPPFEGNGPSIFLAGPTPRSRDVASWRPAAIEMFKELAFDGTLIVPERRDRTVKVDYLDQVEWEYAGLKGATVIMFWVPRQLDTMPAFTTNVEFGRFVGERICVYGRPPLAPKNRYLDWLYRKETDQDPFDTLEQTTQRSWDICSSIYGTDRICHPAS